MNIVIIEGHQTLPHTISLLKVITDSHYTLRTRGRNPSPLTDHFMRKKRKTRDTCALREVLSIISSKLDFSSILFIEAFL